MSDRRVLVVVPVYGDLPSLLECVDALAEHLDRERQHVLLVNDCGPDADAIEAALHDRITALPHFRYERNERNLGFVGTCNRAVLELDDSGDDVLLLNSDAVPTAGFLDAMLDVLHGDEHTGVVTARSNNATIASIPYRLTNRGAERTAARTSVVWSSLVDNLPDSQVMPVAMGFCFLTRRSLIEEHGLFDDAFAPGYGEENDYCLRIAAHGWNARIANRALVLHHGSKSFTGNRNALRTAHQRELERRYPFLPDAVTAYQRHGMSAAERFADCLVPSGALPRVVIDLRSVDDAAAAESLLREFAASFPSSRFGLEALLAPASPAASASSSAPDVVASGVVASDSANPDDLVTATVLVDPTAAQLVEANRRSMLIGIVRSTAPVIPWSSASLRGGADAVATLADRHAVGVVAPGSLGDLVPKLDGVLGSPLSARVRGVTARWTALQALDVTAFDVARQHEGDETARLRAELADLRASRSFRAGSAIARVAARIPGRR